jgi:hypothetical protein
MKQIFSLCLIILTAVASIEATAVQNIPELQAQAEHAKKFLCSFGYCLEKTPPLVLEKVEGYLGYVDGTSSQVSISPDLDSGDTQLALVHEFTHVYRAQFNPREDLWLNEGLAKLMEYQYSGVWPLLYIRRLRENPVLTLGPIYDSEKKEVNYAANGMGYQSSFFMLLYLYNHYGQEKLISKLLRSPKSGWDNVITAIQELQHEGQLPMSAEVLTKESILRHFAVALWLNDNYSAKYGLFHLDSQYEPLSQVADLKLSALTPTAPGLVQIQFSRQFAATSAEEVYSLLSEQPFVIQSAEPGDQPRVFIYLSY